MTTFKLELGLVFPSDAGACDACIGRVLACLRGSWDAIGATVCLAGMAIIYFGPRA